MKHVVQFSGGVGSWATAKRVAEQHGTKDLVLLFANVRAEHPDTYRFLVEASANVGAPLTVIQDGRTPMKVMSDERMIGNSRFDPCSKILKRQLLDRWLTANCDPADTVRYIGIDWTEIHRIVTFRERVKPWHVEAPMCEPPLMDKSGMKAWLTSEGIELPELYKLGFSHNNCGGGCIKAGQGQWALYLKHFPEGYKKWEDWEEMERARLGDHSILRDRSGGESKPLTLRNFRLRVEAKKEYDQLELGGCGCAL